MADTFWSPSEVAAPPQILVVDDHSENLVAMEAILRRLDAEMITACSGEEALSKLLHHDFAVILMDVQMPGMDGFETARLIQGNESTRHVPIIFVTAISKDDRYVFKGYETGAVDYLFKPLDPQILRSKVNVFLELYRHRQALQKAHQVILDKERAVAAEHEKRLQLERESATALREKSEELSHSNKELEQFAFVVSHDLQEPLRTVTSYVQLLERRYKDALDQDATDFIYYAVDGAARMRRLIQDMLRFSRVGTRGRELEPTPVGEILRQVLQDLQVALEESKGEVRSGDLPTVMADPGQLRQLMQNLIGNAIKFRRDEPPIVRIKAEKEGEAWCLSIRDNGIGIEPQFCKMIFGVFKRLHGRDAYPGTGIGLAICKKIVERHGGRLWVESEPGEGTTFHFTMMAGQITKVVSG